MIKRIINARSKTITYSAALIAFSVGVSALLGLLRDRLLVSYFDVSRLDIYFAAFSIPNFIYGILITGGIVAAFLPVFANSLEKDRENGWKLANNTLNVLLLLLAFLCVILFFFAPFIVKIIAPGFSPDFIEKTVFLTRIMLLSPILLGVSSLFSGVLQYFDRFLAYSLAPVFYNIGIILGIIFLTPLFGIVGLAYGVILGSFLHLFVQLPVAFSSGFSYKPVFDLKQKELRRIIYLILPRIVGQASTKINIIVITALASTLTAGSISIFNLANHLQSFPVRIIGVAFAVAAFPSFSKSLAGKNKEKFLESFSSVLRQALFFIIPISVIVFLLRAHIVRLVLGAEGFGWKETQLTAASLGIFAFSFFAAAIIHILVRAFFSFQDTRTPVIASLISMAVNIVFSFFFVWVLAGETIFREKVATLLRLEAISDIEVVAFPIAILLSSLLHLFLLILFLKRKVGNFKGLGISSCLKRTVFSSFIAALLMYIALKVTGTVIVLDTFLSVFLQAFIVFLVALLSYLFVSWLVKSPELKLICGAFFKKKNPL